MIRCVSYECARKAAWDAHLEEAVIQVQANHPAGRVHNADLAIITRPANMVLDVPIGPCDQLACHREPHDPDNSMSMSEEIMKTDPIDRTAALRKKAHLKALLWITSDILPMECMVCGILTCLGVILQQAELVALCGQEEQVFALALRGTSVRAGKKGVTKEKNPFSMVHYISLTIRPSP